MKILFFVASFPCISETFVLNQITGLIDKGHDIRIFSWGLPDTNKPHEDILKYNLTERVYYLRRSIPSNKILRILRIVPFVTSAIISGKYNIRLLVSSQYGKLASNLTLLYIADTLKKIDWVPDAIISHFGDNGLIISSMKRANIISKNTKHYVFFHAHELCRMSINKLKSFYKPLFESDDLLLPISDFWRRKLLKAGAKDVSLKVFHMGIDSSKFNYHSPRKIKDKINILSVGRLVGQKGYEYSLRAIADFVATSKLEVEYKIIGGGPLEGKLRKMANEFGISNQVIFLGAQKQEIVLQLLTEADVFLLPSVTDDCGYMEGIPVALMEAMAMGKICISTSHSGIPELIENLKTGFLCKEKNYSDIVKALNQIVQRSELELEQMSRSARLFVESEFNIKKLIQNLDEMLTYDKKNERTINFIHSTSL